VRRILVVDDVPEIADLVSALLSRIPGASIVTQSDPTKALAWLREQDVDLVVSDFRMPGLDGLSLLQEARRLHPRAGRVLMTGYNELPATAADVESAGLGACLQKPLDPDGLVAVVKRLLAT
jgi:two-component system, probable response regulator PhcQ